MNAPSLPAETAMPLTSRQTGWLLAACILVLSGCQRESATPGTPARSTPTASERRAEISSVDARRGSVTIAGGEEDAAVLWQAPQVQIAVDGASAARRKAAAALQSGHLYEDADAAIPIYLALLEDPRESAAASAGLRRAVQALHRHAQQALARADDDPAALREAHTLATVLQTVAAEEQATAAYVQAVHVADRLWALNAEAEDDIRAGRFGVQGGGALTSLREILRLRPGQARALQGVAAVESGLIGNAERSALQDDFDGARRWLQMAAAVRDGGPSIQDAEARLQILRLLKIAALRDAGLQALGQYDGVRKARSHLATMLRIAGPGDPSATELRNAIDIATYYGQFRPGQVFNDATKDGREGPQMIVVPHGAFWMGAREDAPLAESYEMPARYIRFERGFAMSTREISVGEFRRYLAATKARTRSIRRGYSMPYDERASNFVRRSGVDTDSDYLGRWADDNLPVVHVSAADADAYARWLSQATGHGYRLPSEAEYEYALKAGASGIYPWGDGSRPPAGFGNLTGGDDRSPGGRSWDNAFRGYGDGYWGPAPVGSFRVNPFGLYDLSGNVNEWVADCWHDSYQRAPKDAQPWFNPGCRTRVIRGGAWSSSPIQFRSTWRAPIDVDTTNAQIGFRVVRDL